MNTNKSTKRPAIFPNLGFSTRNSTSVSFVLWLLLVLNSSPTRRRCRHLAWAQNNETHFLDRFTYQSETIDRGDGFFDYRPQEWSAIDCDHSTRQALDQCLGYAYKWHEGINWTIQDNYCKWCPAVEEGGEPQQQLCGDRHHQSPINLEREYGFENSTNPNVMDCIDLHWMKYEDSFCTLDQLVDADAFTIERHGLRIAQPITVYDDITEDVDGVVDGVRLNCRLPGNGTRFGRIDFSKGFSDWWLLSHIDIHVPSEHTQEGKRYSAEIEMYHFYSIDYDNEMATVSVFMEAYDDAPPYRFLDKVICQWRRKEYETRLQCGLDPIDSTYPGCFPLKRQRDRRRHLKRKTNVDDSPTSQESGAFEGTFANKKPKFRTFADVIYHNEMNRDNPHHRPVEIEIDDENFDEADEKDWDAWIAQQSQRMKQEDELYHKLKNNDYGGKHTDDMHEKYRNLIMGDENEWFNYWPMIGVRTEYYYRYQGTSTTPPCYGADQFGTRRGVNHWRVLKDPIRIHPRQLFELERLIRERIAPPDDNVNPCQPDTAADVDSNGKVNTARPLMYHSPRAHAKTFCECKDWESKWPEDRAWCEMQDIYERFYEQPYNFESDGW